MKRKYNIDMAKSNLDYLRKCIPGVMLSADVITGFPNESDDDFAKTYEFFKNEKFLHLHIFPYSIRKGTVAATMKNQVPDAVKKERLHSLSALQDKIRTELLDDFIKKHGNVDVLFENTVDGYAMGHAPNFMEVKVKTECNLGGKIVRVKLTHSDDSYLYGEI